MITYWVYEKPIGCVGLMLIVWRKVLSHEKTVCLICFPIKVFFSYWSQILYSLAFFVSSSSLLILSHFHFTSFRDISSSPIFTTCTLFFLFLVCRSASSWVTHRVQMYSTVWLGSLSGGFFNQAQWLYHLCSSSVFLCKIEVWCLEGQSSFFFSICLSLASSIISTFHWL